MTDTKTFDDTSPFKEQVLGDKPDTHEVVIANKSEIKDFYDPLTHIRFELKTETTVRIKGDLAHKQFLANIEQINTLNGSNQLVVSSDTNVDGNSSDTGSNGSGDTGSNGSNGTITVDGITVSPKTKTIDPSKTFQITATIDPENATNKNVVWFSEDESLATVDANGLVTAVKTGKVKITAMAQDGGFKANTQVTIRGLVNSITLSSEKTQITSTDTQQINAVVSPADATDPTVTWSSSDAEKATVDANGLVTAGKTTGDVVITATSNDGSGVTGTITLNIVSPAV